jgi:hypothetical protein
MNVKIWTLCHQIFIALVCFELFASLYVVPEYHLDDYIGKADTAASQ